MIKEHLSLQELKVSARRFSQFKENIYSIKKTFYTFKMSNRIRWR